MQHAQRGNFSHEKSGLSFSSQRIGDSRVRPPISTGISIWKKPDYL